MSGRKTKKNSFVKKKWLLVAICGLSIAAYNTQQVEASSINKLDTDKAMYTPKSKLRLSVEFTNTDVSSKGYYKVLLENPVANSSDGYAIRKEQTGPWECKKNKTITLASGSLDMDLPEYDGRGYLVTVQFYNYDHQLLAEKTTAVDVSSKWTMYPRYASLGRWDTSLSEQNRNIADLKKLHINATMYYDAYYRPQNPFPHETFKDWIGATVNQRNIRNAIKQNHKYGQSAMMYNMVNATTGTPDDRDAKMNDNGDAFKTIIKKDGTKAVESKWGIYRTSPANTGDGANTADNIGEQKTFNMLGGFDNRDNVSHQVQSYYNMWSKDWQKYIGDKMWGALTYMGFDGWQGDTIGNDTAVSYENRYSLKDKFPVVSGFGSFTEAMKTNQMKKFDFGINAVGGQGQKDLDKSQADFMYSEIWANNDVDDNTAPGNTNGTHTTYDALARAVDNTMQNSKKSLIVPAYIYHDYHPEWMSDKAVLLKNISVLAAGGSNMELTDGVNELYSEYYTGVSKDKKSKLSSYMSDPDNGGLRKLYDFQVAYENFLRGGNLQTNHHKIEVTQNGQDMGSNHGEANKIWYMTKSGHGNKIDDAETINLINFCDVSHIGWQIQNQSDDDNKQINPQYNVHIKYYVDPGRNISNVWIASPDKWLDGKNQKLSFSQGKDNTGNYIEFNIPRLDYWDLIYMK
ncbi:glycoside hydrolase family 66 protein [Ligilactobacillus faecis]|uniref:Glycoside hydrolase family 66 protein n=1 Tax=Ligilactobacillus faecis TaxID=762833 RepID=A0ABV4DM08_9LACO